MTLCHIVKILYDRVSFVNENMTLCHTKGKETPSYIPSIFDHKKMVSAPNTVVSYRTEVQAPQFLNKAKLV